MLKCDNLVVTCKTWPCQMYLYSKFQIKFNILVDVQWTLSKTIHYQYICQKSFEMNIVENVRRDVLSGVPEKLPKT